LPSSANPFPILPQKWHFAQSIQYELSANRAVMDIASKYREDFLFNAWRMGQNSIDRGSRDSWTLKPLRVDAVKKAVPADRGGRAITGDPSKYIAILEDREARDPRGYIIPSDQSDFATAVRFINTLVKNGITIHRATSAFSVAGKSYPAGSYVVKTAQAFRPHVLDMFEPQNHPDDIPYPGGPPTPPYDNAGWTLAYQMGVKFDRILDPFNGPFEKLAGFAPVPAAAAPVTAAWYSFGRETNDAYAAVNRLLKAGQEVYSLSQAPGTFFIRSSANTPSLVSAIAKERGLSFIPVSSAPEMSKLKRLHVPRVALWDVYGGEISSGWMRFVFDQFEFPYDVVYANDIDNSDLSAKYDVLILPDGAVLSAAPDSALSFQSRSQPAPEKIPEQYRSHLGRITVAKSLPRIKSFVENGGTLLALGDAAEIAYRLELPLSDAVVGEDDKPLPRSKYYVPGSVLSVAVDNTNPIAWGAAQRADIFFDNNPAFRIKTSGVDRGVHRVAWFDSPAPLRSGWAWGQKVLDGAAEIVTVPLGKGTVVLYGPQVHFRGQTHGAFRFLFNGIYFGQLD